MAESSPDVGVWTSYDSKLCTLLGVGGGYVFASRASKRKVQSLINELFAGASPADVFQEHGELTLLREVDEVRVIEGRKVDGEFYGPCISVRRRGKPPLEMSLPGGLDQGADIVREFRDRLGPSYVVVKIPISGALGMFLLPFALGASMIAAWAMLALPVFFPAWIESEEQKVRDMGSRLSSKAEFWKWASGLLGKPVIIALGVVLICWIGYEAVSLVLKRPRCEAIRKR